MNESCRLCTSRPLPVLTYVLVSFYPCLYVCVVAARCSFTSPPPPQPPPLFISDPQPCAAEPVATYCNRQLCSLPFCGADKGGQCPLAGYVTGCHMRRTLRDGPVLSAVTTQITSTASHLISTSNSISAN